MERKNLIEEILNIGYIYHTPIPSKEDMSIMSDKKLQDTYEIIITNLKKSNKI